MTCCIFTLLHQNSSETLGKMLGIGLPLDREKVSLVFPKIQTVRLSVYLWTLDPHFALPDLNVFA